MDLVYLEVLVDLMDLIHHEDLLDPLDHRNHVGREYHLYRCFRENQLGHVDLDRLARQVHLDHLLHRMDLVDRSFLVRQHVP